MMERIDADLALGAGDELIAELEALIASDPLAERLRGQLMLALYRAGRQPDALAVYREISERCATSSGSNRVALCSSWSARSCSRTCRLTHPRARHRAGGESAVGAHSTLGRAHELAEGTALLRLGIRGY